MERFGAKGALLAAVGNGSVEQARSFAAEKKLRFPLYTDPGLKAYTAAGFVKDPLALVKPSVWSNAMRAHRAGFRQGSTQGDVFQLGGILVIDPKGKLLFRQASTSAGDHAEPEEILRALR